jgi:hypothetical protein
LGVRNTPESPTSPGGPRSLGADRRSGREQLRPRTMAVWFPSMPSMAPMELTRAGVAPMASMGGRSGLAFSARTESCDSIRARWANVVMTEGRATPTIRLGDRIRKDFLNFLVKKTIGPPNVWYISLDQAGRYSVCRLPFLCPRERRRCSRSHGEQLPFDDQALTLTPWGKQPVRNPAINPKHF